MSSESPLASRSPPLPASPEAARGGGGAAVAGRVTLPPPAAADARGAALVSDGRRWRAAAAADRVSNRATARSGARRRAPPPRSFELTACVARAYLPNQRCTGFGQLFVHPAGAVPDQYYLFAKAAFELKCRLAAPRPVQLTLRLLLRSVVPDRFVYVLADAAVRAPCATRRVELLVPRFANPRKLLGTKSHLPQYKIQLAVQCGDWIGYAGDVWQGSMRSTRAESTATELSTRGKYFTAKLRGVAGPKLLSDADDRYLKAAFADRAAPEPLAPDSVLRQFRTMRSHPGDLEEDILERQRAEADDDSDGVDIDDGDAAATTTTAAAATGVAADSAATAATSQPPAMAPLSTSSTRRVNFSSPIATASASTTLAGASSDKKAKKKRGASVLDVATPAKRVTRRQSSERLSLGAAGDAVADAAAAAAATTAAIANTPAAQRRLTRRTSTERLIDELAPPPEALGDALGATGDLFAQFLSPADKSGFGMRRRYSVTSSSGSSGGAGRTAPLSNQSTGEVFSAFVSPPLGRTRSATRRLSLNQNGTGDLFAQFDDDNPLDLERF